MTEKLDEMSRNEKSQSVRCKNLYIHMSTLETDLWKMI